MGREYTFWKQAIPALHLLLFSSLVGLFQRFSGPNNYKSSPEIA